MLEAFSKAIIATFLQTCFRIVKLLSAAALTAYWTEERAMLKTLCNLDVSHKNMLTEFYDRRTCSLSVGRFDESAILQLAVYGILECDRRYVTLTPIARKYLKKWLDKEDYGPPRRRFD